MQYHECFFSDLVTPSFWGAGGPLAQPGTKAFNRWRLLGGYDFGSEAGWPAHAHSPNSALGPVSASVGLDRSSETEGVAVSASWVGRHVRIGEGGICTHQ